VGADHASLFSLYGYTAAGAIILWGKLAKQGRGVYFLSDLLAIYVPSERWRRVIEPLIFVAFGTYIAVGVIGPTTERQAFAAGLGWTGLASK
jgi:hypothetical protein